jgi:hypothetical protein
MRRPEDRVFGLVLLLTAVLLALTWVIISQEHREIPVMAVIEEQQGEEPTEQAP